MGKTVFSEETWFNKNNTKLTSWTDYTVQSIQWAPIGRGSTLIIVMQDHQMGGSGSAFTSKKNVDFMKKRICKSLNVCFRTPCLITLKNKVLLYSYQ